MPNLVGIGNSQVPTNSMLGGLAYQDPAHANLTNVEIENIAAIKAKINQTAASLNTGEPIFVYDTRKDADGGAWRKRTKDTSWYNETVGEHRGPRKEFPAVAVLVVEDNGTRLTIYDGDDPNLSMWMVFPTTASQQNMIAGFNDHDLRAVSALNGKICVVNWSSWNHGGLVQINLITDDALATCHTNDKRWHGGIVNRNSASYWLDVSSGSANYLYTNRCGDVAMYAFPDAPIDYKTGLPRPTIAVATETAICVLLPDTSGTQYEKNDGRVVDIRGSNSSHDFCKHVAFGLDGSLYAEWGSDSGAGDSNNWVHVFDKIPTVDSIITVNSHTGTNEVHPDAVYSVQDLDHTGADNDLHLTGYTDTQNGIVSQGTNRSIDVLEPVRGGLATGQEHGLAIVAENKPDPYEGMVSHITSTYNTGWMHGDINFASLADTDTTEIAATDLAPNNCATAGPGRTEANATTGWTNAGMATFASSNTRSSSGSYSLHLTADSNGDACYFSFTTVVGKVYTISCKLWVTHDSFTIKLGTSGIDGNQYFESPAINANASWQVFSQQFTATATTSYFNVTESSTSQDSDGYIDEVVVRESAPMRNHGMVGRYKGLQVFGTLQRTPVATGAELVCYEDFSSGSRYLFQPYTDALNATNKFCVMFWVKGWTSSRDLMHRGPDQTRNSKTSWHLYCDGGYDYRLTMTTDGSSERTYEIQLGANLNGWQHVCFTLGGEVVRGYLNGEEKQIVGGMSPAYHFDGNIFSQGTDRNGLWIGRGPVSTDFNGSLALLRIGRSVPSAEQVRKIYDDEFALFQPNAKCTLYGGSDAITAIGFDDSNDTLHVGTSAGRSEFNKLNRINNTTTAVTTAISVSNGLVAEQ